jgi:preprotein translocase subunit YajC
MDMFLSLQDSGAGAGAAPQQPPAFSMMVPIVLMVVVFYFIVIRPQGKQRKERDLMLNNLKKNDHVITTMGIYGVVKQIDAEKAFLTLCIDEKNDVCIRVSKASIAGLEGDSKVDPQIEPADKKKS